MTPAAADGQLRARISRLSAEIRQLAVKGRRTRLASITAALFCLLAGIYLALHREDASHLREASDHNRSGRHANALQELAAIDRRPAETRALLLRAHVLRDAGRRAEALDAFALAADREPRNWEIRRDWAIELRAAGRRRAAARQMGAALALNPALELPPDFRASD